MNKIDHRQTLKHLYNFPKAKPVIVTVPAMNFLMVDGHGKPSGPEFQEAAGVLYPLAYLLKFGVRASHDLDYHVMPLEVCWRVNRQAREFAWTMMLMQPEPVTAEMVAETMIKARDKVPPEQLTRLRFESFVEGPCVQLLYVGPYPGMDPAMEGMIAFAEQNGYSVPSRGTHDIYLNNSRKTRPENLRSIMRLRITPQ
jgi:hypothetical protein